MKKSNAFFVQFVQAIMSLFLLGLLGLTLFRPDLLKSWTDFIEVWSKGIGNWNLLIVLSSSLIESFPVIGVMVPWQLILITVGGFYGQDHLFLAFLWASVGAMLGNWIGYWLGVRYGNHFLDNYGEIFALGKTERKILGRKINENGALFIILWKFHNSTRAFVPFLAGSLQMQNSKFWKYNIAGSILWAGTMLAIGVFFSFYKDTILDWISWFFLGIILLLLAYLFLFQREALNKYWTEKLEELNKK